MPSSENLFTLDPVKTALTKSTTDVKVQGPANRTVENNQLLKGLQNFSSAIGSFAEVKKQKQIQADTRLAENAAIKGDVEPSGILGIASEAFDRIVEGNTLNKTLGEIKAFRDGEDGANLVNGPGSLSEKNALADEVFDKFLAYGYSPIQTPALQQDFRNKVEVQRNKTKIEIAKVNSNRNRLQVIGRLQNVFNEVVDYSKDADDRFEGGTSNESDIEGYTRQPFGSVLKNNLNIKLINQLAQDTVNLEMGIGLQEAKLLTLQVAFQNEDVIAHPKVAEALMASEHSSGVTYNALYLKALSPNNTDKDAAEVFKMRNTQLANTVKHFKDIEANNKAAKAHAESYLNTELSKIYENNGTVDDAIALARSLGVTDIGALLKIRTEGRKYLEGEKASMTSPKGRAFAKALAGAKITASEVTLAMIENNISLNDKQYYTDLAAVESNQIQKVQKSYDDVIKVVKAQRMSLLKSAIGTADVFNPDDSINEKAFMSHILKLNVDPKVSFQVLQQIQQLDEDFDAKSAAAARYAAKEDNFNIRTEVDLFQKEYYNRVTGLIDKIKIGLKDPETEAKAEEKKLKEQAGFNVAPFTMEELTDTPTLLKQMKTTVEEEHKNNPVPKDVNEKNISVSNTVPTSGDDSKKTPINKDLAILDLIEQLQNTQSVASSIVDGPKKKKNEDGVVIVKQGRTKGMLKETVTKLRSVTAEATLGSNIYNAAPTEKERNEWAVSYEQNVLRFRENKLTKKEKINANRMISVLNKAKDSFKGDLKLLNISHKDFVERMIGVYGAETSFGRDENFLKTGQSETGVRGELQTTFETFTDVLGPKGNFGPMMAKAAGYDIKKLRSMNRKQLENILYKPDFNYLAGAAIMLYKLQYKNGVK